MINALTLNFRRNETSVAIKNFLSNVTYENRTENRSVINYSNKFKQYSIEILNEYTSFAEMIENDQVVYHEISPLIKKILNENSTYSKSVLFINKCEKIRLLLAVFIVLGFLSMIFSFIIRNVIDIYFFCFLVWILSCISLLVTLNLIIKDWKQNTYVKEK